MLEDVEDRIEGMKLEVGQFQVQQTGEMGQDQDCQALDGVGGEVAKADCDQDVADVADYYENPMVVGRQALFRQPEVKQVLIPIRILEVVEPKIPLIEVHKCPNRQGHHGHQHPKTEYHIRHLTPI